MSGPLAELSRAFQKNIDGEDNDAIFDALVFLQELEEAECYAPGYLELMRLLAAEKRASAEAAEERKTAEAYLLSGKFDDASTAYFHLYYRTERKGFGAIRTMRVAEHGLAEAGASGRSKAVAALKETIDALKDSPGSEATQAAAGVLDCRFRHGLRSLLTGT